MPEVAPVYVESSSPPSSYAIADVYEGQPGAWGRVLVSTAQRGLFILPGLWLARVRGPQLLIGSITGSVTITLALFGFYGLRRYGVFRSQNRNGRVV